MEQAPQAQPAVSPVAALAQSMIAEADSSADPNSWGEQAPQEEAPPTEAQPDQEQTEQVAEEAPEGQAEAVELVDLDIDGEVLKVPPKVKEGWMKDKDYRQKTAEVAEQRRAVEGARQSVSQQLQAAQQLVAQAQQFAPVLGQVTALDSQMQSLRAQLTPQLKMEDPTQFNTIGTELMLLNQHREQILGAAQAHMAQFQQHVQAVNAQANRERIAEAMPVIQKAIKGFDAPMAKRIAEFAVNAGLPREALEYANSSAPVVILLHKAMEYDRIQAETKVSLKKVEGLPPVVKPSARTQSSESKTREDKLRENFRKSGGKDEATSRAILRERLGFGGK